MQSNSTSPRVSRTQREHQWQDGPGILRPGIPDGPDVCQAPTQFLRAVVCLRSLDDDALAALAAVAHQRIYRRGALVEESAATRGALFVVAHGAVRLFRLARDGREATLSTRQPGDAFAFLSRDQDGHPRDQAAALTDGTRVYGIPARTIQQLLQTHPQVALAAIDELCTLLVVFADRIEDLMSYDMEARLAHTLAQLAIATADHVVWETHEGLACLVGTSRERVTKELGHLRQRGVIAYQMHHHGIHVLDPDYLRSM